MDMDIEYQLLKEYTEYITSKVEYKVKILSKTPKSLTSFPTIIFKENSNIENSSGSSTDGLEYVDQLLYTVEIYTKDTEIEGKVVISNVLMKELKQLTFEFFRQIGFNRMSGEKGEYPDFTVDRYIIVEQGLLNNWDKKIR